MDWIGSGGLRNRVGFPSRLPIGQANAAHVVREPPWSFTFALPVLLTVLGSNFRDLATLRVDQNFVILNALQDLNLKVHRCSPGSASGRSIRVARSGEC